MYGYRTNVDSNCVGTGSPAFGVCSKIEIWTRKYLPSPTSYKSNSLMIPFFLELTTQTRMAHRTTALREGWARKIRDAGGKEIGENPKMF